MAEKGLILTQFEDCFGMFVDHEIIKCILQTFLWNQNQSLQALISMVDMGTISESARAKIDCLSAYVQTSSHSLDLSKGSCESSLDVINSNNTNERENAETTVSTSGKQDYTTKLISVIDNKDGAWNQSKNLKFDNSNLSYKTTNLSQNLRLTNDHKNYDRFLSNQSQIRKGTNFSGVNNRALQDCNEVAVAEKTTCLVQVINTMIQNGNNVLVIMRGLPGSGKSTLARKIAINVAIVLSTDDFFIHRNGKYMFQPYRIAEAHEWNQRRTKTYLRNQKSVIIDNTNLELWEMQPYVRMAYEFNYKVEFLEPDTYWKYDPRELERRTTHGVPRYKIEEMLTRFCKNIKLSDFNLPYNYNSNDGVVTKPKLSNLKANSSKNFEVNINPHGYIPPTKNVPLVQIMNNISKNENNNVKDELQGKPPSALAALNTFKTNISNNYLIHSRESSPNSVDSEDFDDMVKSLGTEIRKQVNKRKSEGDSCTVGENSTRSEDQEMYKFCEDLEDKLGNSIPALLRSNIPSKDDVPDNGPESPGRSAKIVKAPALYTVTEELTKDMSSSNNKSFSEESDDDTSNDASSVELLKDDSTYCGEPSSTSQVESWNSNGGGVQSNNNLDIADDLQNMKIASEPLEARDITQKSIEIVSDYVVDVDIQNQYSLQKCTDDKNDSWTANFEANNLGDSSDYDTKMSLMRKTGAVPKRSREAMIETKHRQNKNAASSPAKKGGSSHDATTLVGATSSPTLSELIVCLEISTQTVLIETDDEQCKVLFGNGQNFHSKSIVPDSGKGPITTGDLCLDKGSMTDCVLSQYQGRNIDQLQALFPLIAHDDLKEVLDKCKQNVNWAVNVLFDSGYAIGEGTGKESKNVVSYLAVDASSSSSSDSASTSRSSRKRRKRKQKQSQIKDSDENHSDESDLLSDSCKSSPSIKSNNSDRSKNSSPNQSRDSSASSSAFQEIRSLSINLDPLFASQLINCFGPVANQNLKASDRNVSLPLSLCREIHKYWSQSQVQDSEVGSSLLEERCASDAAYAQLLQSKEQNNGSISSPPPPPPSSFFGGFDCEEPPTNLKEIMNLEKALQVSQRKDVNTTLSYRLSEQRLCEQFSHINSSAVKDTLNLYSGNSAEATIQLTDCYGAATKKSASDNDAETLLAAMADTKQAVEITEQSKRSLDIVCNDEKIDSTDPQVRFTQFS